MKAKKAMIFFVTEIACFEIIGYILLGPVIFKFNTTAIFTVIFGITAILFFTILEFWNIRDFIYLGLLISLFIVYAWSRNKSFAEIIRNSLWFITIGLFTFLSHKVIKAWNPRKFKVVPLLAWLISFNCIYLIMLVFNLYIFKFYRLSEDLTFIYYLKQALKLETVIGISIGLGYILANIIIERIKFSNK